MSMSKAAPRSNRILIAHSYYIRYDPKQQRRMKPYPPLGTLIAAAVVRDAGHEVHLFDAMLEDGVEQFAVRLDAVRPGLVAILEDNFNFLTKMCTLRMRQAACAMIEQAKARGCRVVVNGSDASDHPELYLGAGADAVIAGAVEPTFLELARLWREDPRGDLSGVAGLVLAGTAGQGVLRRTAPRAALEDLDALPFPAWDLIDVKRYRSAWRAAHGRVSWNMAASRGCPYGCNWCAKPLFGRRYVQRTPASVAEELRRLQRAVAPDHIWFADDIFGLTPAWIEEFAAEVERRDARIPFTIQSRVNLMRPAAVAALRRAGAEEVWLGVESGSQRILSAMEKGTTVAQVREATRTLKAHGVRTGWFLQLGYLGEDWDDLRATRELVAAERPDDIGVSVSYPLPGTPFHDAVRAHLGAKRNWDHTDDLDMLFHGTYVADFYRTVRDLLHEEVASWSNGAADGRYTERWSELAATQSQYLNPVMLHA
jgi:anaerobic magnesium-protoporphyrin IX monomethyl ester cyclase